MIINPKLSQMIAIKVGLRAYARHKIKVNRAYTPKAMMMMASKLTGKTFNARDYLGAADALEKAADRLHEQLQVAAATKRALGEDFGGAL
jgi:hypothetical protein